MVESITTAALDYHKNPMPGKISVELSKPTNTQKDLSLAYTPGVAEPVRAIARDPNAAYDYTIKGNLVAVITNGTAILGLGNLGPLAAKPVMEGKAVLFKRFANVDVFDIEVEAEAPADFIDTVVRIAPTFGGINLEDIKGPECFEIEAALIERLSIPVFHDDQHGTAIIIAAGLLNALELQGKTLAAARIVCLGAGAAGIASMQLLVSMGACPENILMIDRDGVIRSDRASINTYKRSWARPTTRHTLADALVDADVLIGLSGANLVEPAWVARMAPRPVMFVLSNPDPEIHPDAIHAVRSDAIVATGRSDFPNQVNNALCFPYMFRGALDVRARRINIEMRIAAVEAIRALAKLPIPPEVREAYAGLLPEGFGPTYILPTLMDPRLLLCVPQKIAHAAVDTGVAQLPYPAHYPHLHTENS